MKRLLPILFLLILAGCSFKNFPTRFYTFNSIEPTQQLDSIIKADTLNIMSNYKKWTKNMFITSDSVMTIQYTAVCQKNDTTFIISVTETEGKPATIKYRKESIE